jgi:hypothetical protein
LLKDHVHSALVRYGEAWLLGDLDGKPEGLNTAQGRAIVGLDTRKARRNFLLLQPVAAQLGGVARA